MKIIRRYTIEHGWECIPKVGFVWKQWEKNDDGTISNEMVISFTPRMPLKKPLDAEPEPHERAAFDLWYQEQYKCRVGRLYWIFDPDPKCGWGWQLASTSPL